MTVNERAFLHALAEWVKYGGIRAEATPVSIAACALLEEAPITQSRAEDMIKTAEMILNAARTLAAIVKERDREAKK